MIGFRWFPARSHVGRRHSIGLPRQRDPRCKGIIQVQRRIQVQQNLTFGNPGTIEVAIDGNAIDRPFHRGEFDQGSAALAPVVVLPDQHQVAQRRSGVNREHGIHGTSQGIQDVRSLGRSHPAPPDGLPARVAGVIGFSWFLGGTPVVIEDRRRAVRIFQGLGEEVIVVRLLQLQRNKSRCRNSVGVPRPRHRDCVAGAGDRPKKHLARGNHFQPFVVIRHHRCQRAKFCSSIHRQHCVERGPSGVGAALGIELNQSVRGRRPGPPNRGSLIHPAVDRLSQFHGGAKIVTKDRHTSSFKRNPSGEGVLCQSGKHPKGCARTGDAAEGVGDNHGILALIRRRYLGEREARVGGAFYANPLLPPLIGQRKTPRGHHTKGHIGSQAGRYDLANRLIDHLGKRRLYGKLKSETNVPRSAEVAIHHDSIVGTSGRRKGHLTRGDPGGIVVLCHQRQLIHGIALVHRQDRVQIAARGLDRYHAIIRGHPGPPDGRGRRIAGVIGFTQFGGRLGTGRFDRNRIAREQ